MSSRKPTSSSCTCREGEERAAPRSGVYCLVLWLPRARSITHSRKGSCRLERGWYVYTGSAKRNLLPRLMRHLRRRKTLHWHIDHLRAVASLRQIWIWPWTAGEECRTNTMVRRMPEATCPILGFGASDCRCAAHLVSFPSEPMPPGHGVSFAYRVRRARVTADRLAARSGRAAPIPTKIQPA
jgi:sugar fermentation stimulation protein A